MLQIVIIFAWVLAACLAVYLAARAIRNRLLGRHRRKMALRRLRAFRRRHHFDQKQQRWIRKVDGVAMIDEPAEDRRFVLACLGLILFVLWEGYWLLEVVERFSKSTHPLQLPYVFLFVILVIVPLAGYFLFRRLMRRPGRLPLAP
jgi:hypothetical protein